MTWRKLSLTCVFLCVLTSAASAGIFFNRQPKVKPRPEDRVPELVAALRTDPDENKRTAAATELRQYDSKTFKEIVPVLVEVLKTDTRAGVRYEAAVTLSRIRPVSAEAGMALEHASAHDAAFYVRMQARTSLVYYRLSGYRTPRAKEPKTAKKSPRKRDAAATMVASPKETRLTPLPDPSKTGVTTSAKTQPVSVHPLPDNTVARPLPQGPVKSTLVPVEPPKLETPPPSRDEDGPMLVPPPY